MVSKYEWYKTTLEFLKGNKVFLLIVSTALASGTAGYKLPSLINAAPVEVTVKVPTNNGCSACMKEIKKLKRWHE